MGAADTCNCLRSTLEARLTALAVMADCVATLQGVAVRRYQPCFNVAHSYNLRNASGVIVYNPLGCDRRRNRLLLAKINIKVGDLSSNDRRSLSPVCVAANNSAQEPIQLSAEVEEELDTGDIEKRSFRTPASAAIRFSSSLVSAVASIGSGDSENPEKKKRNRKGERTVYLLAAIASSIGFTALSAGAVFYRFHWQLRVRIFLNEIA